MKLTVRFEIEKEIVEVSHEITSTDLKQGLYRDPRQHLLHVTQLLVKDMYNKLEKEGKL